MSTTRAARAQAFYEELMTDGYDEERILVGSGLSPEEAEALLDIDPWMETQSHHMVSAFADDLKMPQPRWDENRLRDHEKILIALVDHTLSHGEMSMLRADGVALFNVPAPDRPDQVIAQVALTRSPEGGLVYAGSYHHTSLFVDPDYRGLGIGRDLVVEHILHNGCVLNWSLDSCAYSPGGAATHISALHALESMFENVITHQCTESPQA